MYRGSTARSVHLRHGSQTPLIRTACGVTMEQFVNSLCFQTLNKPALDARLPWNTDPISFAVQRRHCLGREAERALSPYRLQACKIYYIVSEGSRRIRCPGLPAGQSDWRPLM